MIVAIHQPNYIPGLGYFHKMASADCFVLLDNVQYSKNNYTNRNRIRSRTGWSWLTVPVRLSGHFGQEISKIQTADDGWEVKHWKTLAQAYGRAPHTSRYADELMQAYSRRRQNMAEFNIELLEFAWRALGLKTTLIRASDLDVSGYSTELLLSICKVLGATTYLSGQGGKKYLDVSQFEAAGVSVVYQEFVHPQYDQGGKGDFTPNLSILDLIFNVGPGSRDVLAPEKNVQHAESAL